MTKTDKQILSYLYQKRFRKLERISQLQKEVDQLDRDILVQRAKVN